MRHLKGRDEVDPGWSPRNTSFFRSLWREKPEKDTEKLSVMQGEKTKQNRIVVSQKLGEENVLRLPTSLNPAVRSDKLRTAQYPSDEVTWKWLTLAS